MLFEDWKKHNNSNISKHLLWEYDMNRFDWNDMKVIVVQRVIERGRFDDFYAAIKMYGGIKNFKDIIKQIPVLSKKDISFVCSVFNLEENELKCYTRMQLREKLINS